MKSKVRTWSLVGGLIFLISANPLWGADLEDVYGHYLQGNYNKAQETLQQILSRNPDGQTLFDMKKKVGVRALLEMSQNDFLRDLMKTFNSATWQHERTQFKAPRRIRFFISNFMEDDSTRHQSMPNILAAGPYAVPFILEYLKEGNEDLVTRGLAYQLILNMGSEAIAPLLPSTFSKDPVLLVNVVRLLGITRSPRSLPYLLRLRTVKLTNMVRMELENTLSFYSLPEGMTPGRSYIEEANRYLREMDGVYHEGVEADGLLWTWNEEKQNVETENPLGLGFEYRAQYGPALWPLFRAEVMHKEFTGMRGMSAVERQSAHAATLCTWVVQEHRSQEVLKGPELAGVTDIVPALDRFLASRSNKLTVAHWVGIDILLQGVDMAQNLMAPHISARILRMIAGYQPAGADTRSIESFVTREPSQPMIQGLFHREELIRYWSAIAIARTNTSLTTENAPLVVDLLQQAIDEVVTPSILMVSKPSVDAEQVHKKLEDMGYLVKRVDDALDALGALRSFPSKDLLILDPDFEAGARGVQFVNRVREDVKGKDIPLVILSDEERSGKHFITFQEQAQQLIMGSDSIDTLREKLSDLREQKFTVHGPDMALSCSSEALNALIFLKDPTIRLYPSLTKHLSDLLVSKQQPVPSQVMAIRALRKLGPVAADSTNILLEKLDDSQYDVAYKIVVLHALLSVSGPNEDVRQKLFNIIKSEDSPDNFKQMAASYLSNEFENLSEEEKLTFQNSFFSKALLPDSGS